MIYCIRCYAEDNHHVGRRAQEAVFIIAGESVCVKHAKLVESVTLEVDSGINE